MKLFLFRPKALEEPAGLPKLLGGDSLDEVLQRCEAVMAAHAGNKDAMRYEIAAAISILAKEIQALKAAAAPAPKKTRKRKT